MAGNGLVHTIASVFSPAVGAYLVAQLGFIAAFQLLGVILILTGIFALFGIKDIPHAAILKPPATGKLVMPESEATGVPWAFFGLPLAIACSQGILFFELPLLAKTTAAIMDTGILFSVVSLGALITLSMLFLNRVSPLIRTVSGSLALALIFFGLAVEWPLPLAGSLLLIGMAKGVIFPAQSTLLILLSGGNQYGRVFSFMSIAFSIGAFMGPLIAGNLRGNFSPYFIAFTVLMIALIVFPIYFNHKALQPRTQ